MDNGSRKPAGVGAEEYLCHAQVAPVAEAVPPRLYGGTERVVSWLTEELVRKGHQITLFAGGDSKTAAELALCVPQGLRLAGIRDTTAHLLVMLDQVRQRKTSSRQT